VECLVEGGAFGRGHVELTLGRALLALVEGGIPIDGSVAAAAQSTLQLIHQRGNARRVAGKPRRAGQLARVDGRLPTQDVAQHVPKLIFGIVTLVGSGVVLGHFRHLSVTYFYASRRSPARTGK